MRLPKVFLFLVVSIGFGINTIISQNTIDSINYALKSKKYEHAKVLISKLESKDLKLLYNKQVDYYLAGKKIDTSFLAKVITPKTNDSILFKVLKADIYSLGKSKNIEIFKSYFQAYNWYKKNQDTLSVNESLKKLCQYIIYNARKDTLKLKKYVNHLDSFKMDTVDAFWVAYYQLLYNFLVKDYKENSGKLDSSLTSSFKKNEMMNLFKELHKYSFSNKFLRAIYYSILGAYQGDWLKDYSQSNNSFLKAKSLYEDIKSIESERSIARLENNIAINYFKNKDFRSSIPYFKKNLNRDKKALYKMFTNEWLYKCYDSLKKPDSALFYFKKMTKIKEELNQIDNTRQIIAIEAKYNYDEIVSNLEYETKTKKELKSALFTVVPVLGFITVILILIFYLYKRYKRKSKLLETEQSETLKKLDEIKKIVVKNHIVLKDKTKVYVADLIYIKSDDHYLKIITDDGEERKERTVRGKLSQIKKELPPNFIQCHRSYIVNCNFIKQDYSNSLLLKNKERIPLSRSHKDKF